MAAICGGDAVMRSWCAFVARLVRRWCALLDDAGDP
jgi:hypothetical protein